MTVGELLRAARERKRLTQLQVAERLGKTQPTVQSWEADESLPRLAEVREVAQVYGVKPAQLIPRKSA